MSTILTVKQLVLNAAELNSIGKEIQAEGAKLDAKIHLGLCSAVALCHTSGDVTVLNNLVDNLKGGIRTNAALAFALNYAPVRWDKKEKKFRFDKIKRNEGFLDSEVAEKMCADNWVKYRPEAEFQPMDVNKRLGQLVKAMTEKSDDERETISKAQVALAEKFAKEMADLIAKEQADAAVANAEAAISDAPAEEEAA